MGNKKLKNNLEGLPIILFFIGYIGVVFGIIVGIPIGYQISFSVIFGLSVLLYLSFRRNFN